MSLRIAASKKGKLREDDIQLRITETWKILPKQAQVEYLQTEQDKRRKELRNIKENLLKKWRKSREKERKREKAEIERSKTLDEKLGKLEQIKQRLKDEEEKIEEIHERDKIRKRKRRKEKEKEEAKMLVREAEKMERKERQRVLEERWKMVRWLAECMDVNREKWGGCQEADNKMDIEKWEN